MSIDLKLATQAAITAASRLWGAEGVGGSPQLYDPNVLQTLGGHLKWATDNTFDIGADGASRPRTVYVGTKISIAHNALGGQALDVFTGVSGSSLAAFQHQNLATNGSVITVVVGN